MAEDVRKPASEWSETAVYDASSLLDYDRTFIEPEELDQFARALAAPQSQPVTALNDWRPIYQKVRRSRLPRGGVKRSKDETREGFVYSLLRYPLLALILGWVISLFVAYNLTRFYIWAYEYLVSWTGRRQSIRRQLHKAQSYQQWCQEAQRLDDLLGNDDFKRSDSYSYYDHRTVQKVVQQLSELKSQLETKDTDVSRKSIKDLKLCLESCIKSNFVGIENPHLYSETYIGTKDLVQLFIDLCERGLKIILATPHLSRQEKGEFFKSLELNYGRTALCLSGGATFAYYHFGVIKALLDTENLPEIITGTSGGALIAALVATRTDDELRQLLVPELAYRIRACQDGITTWSRRWWKTGARFDAIDWARETSWFTRGSMTFREAYQRTGRILNVSCVPSDPHSPTMLNNHITSPDCVVWSAVLASAAVPGILPPIVLMRKTRDGSLVPYSFGNKWKDGSLRTDIPLKALNLHFNVNFSVVSQVNPHISLFFFAPRGSPGRPVTHRKGRGWRGGFLGSTIETSIKLDLQKHMKILRHLELLPRPMGQDWSQIWLQGFSGTVTIWPKTVLSDFYNILSDPSPQRLARMLRVGERSCWPRIRFVSNRLKIEKIILEGLRRNRRRANQEATPDHALERQEAEHVADDLPAGEANGFMHEQPLMRRQSSIFEELGRQASVLWRDDDEHMSTTDEEDAVKDMEESKAL